MALPHSVHVASNIFLSNFQITSIMSAYLEIKWMKTMLSNFLDLTESPSWWSTFRMALSTVYWFAWVRLEWDFTIFSTTRTDCLMHFFLEQRLFQVLILCCAKKARSSLFLHAALLFASRLINRALKLRTGVCLTCGIGWLILIRFVRGIGAKGRHAFGSLQFFAFA